MGRDGAGGSCDALPLLQEGRGGPVGGHGGAAGRGLGVNQVRVNNVSLSISGVANLCGYRVLTEGPWSNMRIMTSN